MSRNYKKEYETYHSKPEQKIRRAARNAARAKFKDADPNKDVHHKDNNPLNNDKNNLSLVTQHYNRREPRLREEAKDVKKLLSKVKGLSKQQAVLLSQLPLPVLTAIVTQLSHLTMGEEDIQIEDMGTVTGPHIAGTGDDSSTVKVRKKKKVRRRKDESLRSKKNVPSMTSWEKRQQLSRQVRKNFWKSLKGKKKKDVNVKFKLKNSKSLRKRIIDNVLAIQQKV